jgi:hypothetical protein
MTLRLKSPQKATAPNLQSEACIQLATILRTRATTLLHILVLNITLVRLLADPPPVRSLALTLVLARPPCRVAGEELREGGYPFERRGKLDGGVTESGSSPEGKGGEDGRVSGVAGDDRATKRQVRGGRVSMRYMRNDQKEEDSRDVGELAVLAEYAESPFLMGKGCKSAGGTIITR